MDSMKSIIDAAPTTEELQKFSIAVSGIIGESNAVEAAFKGVVLQRYANALKKTSILTEKLFDAAEKSIVSEEKAFPVGSEETLNKKSICQKKEALLKGLLATLRCTNAAVMDLVLVNDETVEIRYESGGCRKVNIACDSGTAMIRDIMAHI